MRSEDGGAKSQPLDRTRPSIVNCPACGQLALEPGDSCLCHFCLRTESAEEVAEEYAWNVQDEYESDLIRNCPECERTSLVGGVTTLEKGPATAIRSLRTGAVLLVG